MITEKDVQNAKKVAEELMRAFTWADTPQGGDYWDKVHEDLTNLKVTEKSKKFMTLEKIDFLRKEIEQLEKTL